MSAPTEPSRSRCPRTWSQRSNPAADLKRGLAEADRPAMAHAKGTVMVEAVKALQAQGERATALLSPKLQAYLTQKIVLASWYPLEDYAEILKAMMKAGGSGRVNPCE